MPSGSASTSAAYVDVSYQRGSQECSLTLNTYRNVEILVYNPGKIGPAQLHSSHSSGRSPFVLTSVS